MKTLAAKSSAIGVMVIVLSVAGPAYAQSGNRKFLGRDITPGAGLYMVTKDANVRAGPKTSAKKIGSIPRGGKVDVAGKAKGGAEWMAVRRGGKDFGFVYAPILLPLLNGSLKRDISGQAKISGRSQCAYTIHFYGRSTAQKELISFADYEVEYRCLDGAKPYRFYAPMFITEVPYRLTQDPVFQISIDLMAVEDDPDNVFSTIFMYRQDKNLVTFDSLSTTTMGVLPKPPDRTARTVPEALAGAVEAAPTVWTKKVWNKLIRLHGKGGG